MSRRKQQKPQALRSDEIENDGRLSLLTVQNDQMENDDTPNDTFEMNETSDVLPDMDGSPNSAENSLGNATSNEGRMDSSNCIFACTYCPACFETYAQVKNHEQEHADLMPYRCPHCMKGFKHKRSLDRHVKLHVGVKKYKCGFCQASFFRSDHLKLHSKTHETSKYQYSCSVCRRGFHSLPGLQSHAVIHDGATDGANKADHAADGIAVKVKVEEMMDHAAEVKQEGERIPGLEPEEEEDREQNGGPGSPVDPLPVEMSSDRQPHPGDFSGITCSVCAAMFPDVDALQTHTLRRHSLNELSASLLQPSTSRFSNQPQHEDPVYSCNHCQRHFDSILSLHSHISQVHENEQLFDCSTSRSIRPDAQVFQCSQCDFAVQNLKAFTCHMRQHLQPPPPLNGAAMNSASDAAPPPLRCDLCALSFLEPAALESHLLTHYMRQDTQYSCAFCDTHSASRISFASLDESHRHLIDFHAKIIYKCSICCDMFESKSDIQSHFIAAHTSALSCFRCRACNAAFASEDQFRVHVRAAHAPSTKAAAASPPVIYNPNVANPFICPLCFASFSVEYLFDKHLQVTHNKSSFNHQRLPLVGGDSFAAATSQRQTAAGGSVAGFLAAVADRMGPVAAPIVAATNKCNICDEKFNNVADLSNHKLVKHCKVVRSERCNVCRDSVLSVDQFFKHIRAHTTPGSHAVCIVCKQSLASVVEMQAHAKFHCGDAAATVASPSSRCSNCGVKFESRRDFDEHQRSCQSLAPNNDGDCQSVVTSDDCQSVVASNARQSDVASSACQSVVDGERSKSPPRSDKVYQCIKCQKSFDSEMQIHEHVAFHMLHDGTDHKCHLCLRIFDSPSKLQRHLIEHSYHQQFSPPSWADNRLTASNGDAGNVDFSCWMCNEPCADSSALQAHVLSSSKHAGDQRPYQCDWCDQKFFFDAELENHLIASHPPNATASPPAASTVCQSLAANACQPLAASVCQATTINSILARSLDHDYDEIPTVPSSSSVVAGGDRSTPTAFLCSLCGVAFNSASTLKSHAAQCRRKSVNSTDSAAAAFCSQRPASGCGLPTMVASRSILAQLMAKNGAKAEPRSRGVGTSVVGGPFQCPNCPKSFLSMSALQGHSHVHMNTIKAHHCDKCKKTFQTAAKLRNHQRQHSTDKPFMCHLCNRYFSRKDNLKVHLKTHFKDGVLIPMSMSDSIDNDNSQVWHASPEGEFETGLIASAAPFNASTSAASFRFFDQSTFDDFGNTTT